MNRIRVQALIKNRTRSSFDYRVIIVCWLFPYIELSESIHVLDSST